MRTLTVRNAHQALPIALAILQQEGARRESRNGPVLQHPWPVATVYEKPLERVVFWPERDANPFFHLYESIWMIAGRNDVAPLVKYVKRSTDYSDDGKTLHGAYGHRWRYHFGVDQLERIAAALKANADDRRCMLQMWDAPSDLGRQGRDFPCNTMATFQIGTDGRLNLVVFCRSNDIVWGCYGANIVQFSTLLEYMAVWIGCEPGNYTQISVNWHGYLTTIQPVQPLADMVLGNQHIGNPYGFTGDGRVIHVGMPNDHMVLDEDIATLLKSVDADFAVVPNMMSSWGRMVYLVLLAHHAYKNTEGPRKYGVALEILKEANQRADWVVAAREWVLRRELAHVKQNP